MKNKKRNRFEGCHPWSSSTFLSCLGSFDSSSFVSHSSLFLQTNNQQLVWTQRGKQSKTGKCPALALPKAAAWTLHERVGGWGSCWMDNSLLWNVTSSFQFSAIKYVKLLQSNLTPTSLSNGCVNSGSSEIYLNYLSPCIKDLTVRK